MREGENVSTLSPGFKATLAELEKRRVKFREPKAKSLPDIKPGIKNDEETSRFIISEWERFTNKRVEELKSLPKDSLYYGYEHEYLCNYPEGRPSGPRAYYLRIFEGVYAGEGILYVTPTLGKGLYKDFFGVPGSSDNMALRLLIDKGKKNWENVRIIKPEIEGTKTGYSMQPFDSRKSMNPGDVAISDFSIYKNSYIAHVYYPLVREGDRASSPSDYEHETKTIKNSVGLLFKFAKNEGMKVIVMHDPNSAHEMGDLGYFGVGRNKKYAKSKNMATLETILENTEKDGPHVMLYSGFSKMELEWMQ